MFFSARSLVVSSPSHRKFIDLLLFNIILIPLAICILFFYIRVFELPIWHIELIEFNVNQVVSK